MSPAGPGAAFDAFSGPAMRRSAEQESWTPEHGALPAIYLGHGAPPVFDDAEWMSEMFAWAQAMPKPKAILMISAHWESAPLSISAPAHGTPLVYDFAGFAPRYFQMTYRSPDAGELADLVAGLLPDNLTLHRHPSRGLDHGAWVPLKVMYPLADVPVIQMSLPTRDPHTLMGLGERLRELRHSGVLIVGSGFMTHGLPFLSRENFLGLSVPGWSRDFDAWAAEALSAGDVDALANYRAAAPGMPYAHPTPEHFTPLFVTLGAATDPTRPVDTAIDGFAMGLAKRSFAIA